MIICKSLGYPCKNYLLPVYYWLTVTVYRFTVAAMYKRNRLLNMPKKPASMDWHRADVIAAFKRKGTSITRESRRLGMNESYLMAALNKPYPKAERLIAEILGIQPQSIWPTRYNEDGSPKSGRGERGIGRHPSNLTQKQNDTPKRSNSNVNTSHEDKQAA